MLHIFTIFATDCLALPFSGAELLVGCADGNVRALDLRPLLSTLAVNSEGGVPASGPNAAGGLSARTLELPVRTALAFDSSAVVALAFDDRATMVCVFFFIALQVLQLIAKLLREIHVIFLISLSEHVLSIIKTENLLKYLK